MRKAIWSASSRQDFARIDDYYAEIDPDYANRVGDEALAAARFLTEFPFAGANLPDTHIRKWAVGRTGYQLLYVVSDEAIEIMRVRHAREDWQSEP
jgi:toxin ParE1/3/4